MKLDADGAKCCIGFSEGRRGQMADDRRIWALDHLRALAAFMVFFWHGLLRDLVPFATVPSDPILGVLEEGWVGVSLFFCITGFIFTVLTHGKEIQYFNFLKNRVLRLLPLLFLVMLWSASTRGQFPKDSLGVFFNLLGGGVVFGTWSLVLEFHFYLAYPFIRQAIIRPTFPQTLMGCGALLLFFFLFRAGHYVSDGDVQKISYWTLFGHVDEFLGGIVGALVFLRYGRDYRPSVRIVSAAVLVASTVAVVSLVWWFNAQGGFRGTASMKITWLYWPTMMGVLWGAIITSYCLFVRGMRGPITRAVAYLGDVSYSTYMLHFITVPACQLFWSKYVNIHLFSSPLYNYSAILLLFIYPVTIIVSALSFEMIEKPFLARRVSYLVRPS